MVRPLAVLVSFQAKRVPAGDATEQGANAVRRRMFLGKIHRATVTQADLDYEGSVTDDAEARVHQPKVVFVDDRNRITGTGAERPGPMLPRHLDDPALVN